MSNNCLKALKKYHILFVIGIIAALFSFVVPTNVSTEIAPLDLSCPYYDDVVECIGEQQLISKAYENDVYLITTSYYGRNSRVEILIPVVSCNIYDVPKAGIGVWSFALKYLCFSWDGEKLSPSSKVLVEDVSLSVNSGFNTLIRFGDSDYSSSLSLEIPNSIWKGEDQFSTSIFAATQDSGLATNSATEVVVTWEGNFRIRQGVIGSNVIPFSASCKESYQSNV